MSGNRFRFRCSACAACARIRGNADCVDGAVGENLTKIPNFPRLMPRSPRRCGGPFEMRLIHIANGRYGYPGLLHGGSQVLRSHHADADERKRHAVVGRNRAPGHRTRGHGLEKAAPSGLLFHEGMIIRGHPAAGPDGRTAQGVSGSGRKS
jgi:hypothetical protein